jgi:hypothetical protein
MGCQISKRADIISLNEKLAAQQRELEEKEKTIEQLKNEFAEAKKFEIRGTGRTDSSKGSNEGSGTSSNSENQQANLPGAMPDPSGASGVGLIFQNINSHLPSVQSTPNDVSPTESAHCGPKMPALFMNVHASKNALQESKKDATADFFENVQNPFAAPTIPSAVPHAPPGDTKTEIFFKWPSKSVDLITNLEFVGPSVAKNPPRPQTAAGQVHRSNYSAHELNAMNRFSGSLSFENYSLTNLSLQESSPERNSTETLQRSSFNSIDSGERPRKRSLTLPPSFGTCWAAEKVEAAIRNNPDEQPVVATPRVSKDDSWGKLGPAHGRFSPDDARNDIICKSESLFKILKPVDNVNDIDQGLLNHQDQNAQNLPQEEVKSKFGHVVDDLEVRHLHSPDPMNRDSFGVG